MFCQYQSRHHSFQQSQFNFDYITVKYKGLEESLNINFSVNELLLLIFSLLFTYPGEYIYVCNSF